MTEEPDGPVVKTAIALVHFTAVAAAWLLAFLAPKFVQRTTNASPEWLAVRAIVFLLAVLGLLAGLSLMARLRRGQESIVLAVSTAAAVLLLLLL